MKIPVKSAKQPTEIRQAGLVEAALRLAAQRSPADITTGDLAKAVGITQGAVFRHFQRGHQEYSTCHHSSLYWLVYST